MNREPLGETTTHCVAGGQKAHRTSLTLEVVADAIVAPLTYLAIGQDAKPGIFDGGVYYEDRKVCASGLQYKAGFCNQPARLPGTADMRRVDGNHLYGGMLKNEHFGHFLVESLGRLWPLIFCASGLDTLVFYVRMPKQPVPRWSRDFLHLIAPGIPLSIVNDCTVFNSLLVPEQIAHPSNGFLYGHEQVRELLRPLRAIRIERAAPKIYVSRSKLVSEGGFLAERMLEENLVREGFVIIHAQELPVRAQIAAYTSASVLIFAEGSAIHLYALVGRPDQRAYIIQRRKHAHVFSWQLQSFGLSPVVGPEAPTAYLIPERAGRDSLKARAQLNFQKLREQLKELDIISGENWQSPDDLYLKWDIARIEKTITQKLVKYLPDEL